VSFKFEISKRYKNILLKFEFEIQNSKKNVKKLSLFNWLF